MSTTETFECELCFDTYPSIRAAMLCEERDRADEREAHRSGRAPRITRGHARGAP